MSEGVNETSVSFVVSSIATTTTDDLNATLECCEDSNSSSSPSSPTSPINSTQHTTKLVRKHRKHSITGRTFHQIDDKKIRSALTHKKWPPSNRRVSFPTNDSELVTGYLEPANPWEHAENVNIKDLISSYKASCRRHGSKPLGNLIAQLKNLDISDDERCPELNLKNECLDQDHCEPLEELLKRVQFEKIDVESSSLDDESATILFDMLEYYQSAKHLNMSSNRNIGSRGWQACAQMIKKTTCLEQFEARDITLTQQHMNILKRPLQLVSHLHVLKLENCGLAGQAFVILVSALKMNTGLKELYLADNCFEQKDAIQLGALLRVNNHLQLLDISNNHIKDEGVRDLMDGLIAQSGERKNGKGLSILVLWNNDLTRSSSTYFTEAIAQSTTLETLNIGKNPVGNELLELAQQTLIKNRTLLQLGMQSTNLTCKGALLLADIIERNRSLQRIDLRDNNIQMEGLAALSFAMKRNPCVTQLDFDPTPWSTKPATMDQYLDLVAEIRNLCMRNEETASTDDSTEESGSPQHRSRLSSVSSRKISLTCQTLPRSPPSIASNSMNEITSRSMLEPKRTSGGRLRSPAPSPIPSPVASPIPSPSRGRFVVSRVCENSLSSTNSSASSSPVTPSSLGSSPTCFFPTTSSNNSSSSSNNSNSSSVVSSRFRVTVVEPTTITSNNGKSIVTSANSNVTIGFNYKIQEPENKSLDSDDSDSVFRSDIDKEDNLSISETNNDLSLTTNNDDKVITSETENTSYDDSAKISQNVPGNIDDNQIYAVTKVKSWEYENNWSIVIDESTSKSSNDNNDLSSSVNDLTRIKEIPSLDSVETKVIESNKTEESLRDEIMACYETESKKPEPVQRQASSLERLLGLFQHPGSLFSGSSYSEKTETKNPLQDGVNSMIALGDKFQQYLRDGRGKNSTDGSPSHPILQRSASDASRSSIKSDPVKSSLSIPQLSSIQAICTRDLIYRDLSTNRTDNSRNLRTNSELVPDNREDTPNERVSGTIDEPTLPEIVRIVDRIDDVTTNDTMKSNDRRDSENLENSSLSLVTDCKTIVCPKLKDIPEYSILETRENISENIENDHQGSSINENSGNNSKIIICDSSSSTTDSINEPSCKISSHFKVKCDIVRDVIDVHTLGNKDDVHNFFTTKSKEIEENDEAIIKNDESSIISISNSIYDEQNSGKLEEIMKNDEDSNYRDDSVEIIADSIDIATRNVDTSLPIFNNYINDRVVTTDNLFDIERCRVQTIFNDQNFRQADTIEEFLPIEIATSSIVRSSRSFVDSFNDNDPYQVVLNKQKCNFIDDNSQIIDENELTITTNDISRIINESSDQRISELFVNLPNTSVVNNEFPIARISIAPIDDDDYAPAASIEQISSSLSEDSGYSGKLSVDEIKNCDIILNDSTEISPANDNSISDNSKIGNVTEKSLNINDSASFICSNLHTNLTSFLSVQDNDTNSLIGNELSEDLIFKITDLDITKDSTSVVTKIQIFDDNSASIVDSYYETEQSSSGNLLIEKSRNVHRNSQDSGIEEAATSIIDDNCRDAVNPSSEHFQESLDSGIDSECSLVCARLDVGADVQKERARDPGKFHDLNIIDDDEIARFTNSQIRIDDTIDNKDIGIYEDSSRVTRCDDDKNVAMKINDVVVGSLEKAT